MLLRGNVKINQNENNRQLSILCVYVGQHKISYKGYDNGWSIKILGLFTCFYYLLQTAI